MVAGRQCVIPQTTLEKTYNEAVQKIQGYDVDFRIVKAHGEIRWLHEFAEVEYDDDGETIALFGIIQDITDRKVVEQQLVTLSRTDDLTGLLNRREFDAQLGQALERNSRTDAKLALLFIDMDGFKVVNDELGHDAGDEVLKEIAVRLKKQIRITDIAGRMGGDEFTIVLNSNIDDDGIAPIVERTLASLAAPYKLQNGKIVNLSGSIGIAIAPDDTREITKLYKIADMAMYEAKKLGKNRFIMGGH